jgi:hypothetical protein
MTFSFESFGRDEHFRGYEKAGQPGQLVFFDPGLKIRGRRWSGVSGKDCRLFPVGLFDLARSVT